MTTSEDLLTHLVAESLLKRIDRQLLDSKNIYVQQLDIPQIVMFYNMAKAVPFVEAGHSIANQYIASALAGLSEADYLRHRDGQGRSAEGLCRRLALSSTPLKSLSIIGLDPDEKNLSEFQRDVDGMRGEVPFRVSFLPIQRPHRGSLLSSNTGKSSASGLEICWSTALSRSITPCTRCTMSS